MCQGENEFVAFSICHSKQEKLAKVFFIRLGSDEEYEDKVSMLQTIVDMRHDAEIEKEQQAKERDDQKHKMGTVNEDGVDVRIVAVKNEQGKVQHCYT